MWKFLLAICEHVCLVWELYVLCAYSVDEAANSTVVCCCCCQNVRAAGGSQTRDENSFVEAPQLVCRCNCWIRIVGLRGLLNQNVSMRQIAYNSNVYIRHHHSERFYSKVNNQMANHLSLSYEYRYECGLKLISNSATPTHQQEETTTQHNFSMRNIILCCYKGSVLMPKLLHLK